MNRLAGKMSRVRDRLVRRREGDGGGRRPRLSVVVPVYNVEDYLAECLDSILTQPFQDLEVVLVDDGSTDSSADIARRYASEHTRVHLISQVNAGLGAARNAGVRAARGEYLTFVDSDDRLPRDAYTAMIRTLAGSGSDFAIGMLKRDEPGRRYAMPRMRDNHRVRRVGVTLDEMPQILADVFAVNKVFRRTFWDSAGLEFPVGIRYEDQPTLTRAFLAATTFDVLTETVYLWRIREDGSSITQRRHDLADLRDRIATKRSSTDMVLAKAPHLRDLWLADIMPVDMWEYFRAVPGCSAEYWDLLRSAVAELWSDDTVPFEHTWIPVQQRLMGWHVRHDRRGDLEEVIAFVDEHGGDLPLDIRGDKVVALLPGVDEPAAGVPQTLFELGDHELRWETRVTEAAWSGEELRLHGFAFMRNVPTDGRSTDLSARLVGPSDPDTGEPVVVLLDVRQVRQPRATKFAGRVGQNYDECGFTLSIDVPAVAAAGGGQATWRIVLERRVEKIRGSGGVTSLDRPDVDRDWHEVVARGGGVVRARLNEVDADLVLEIRSPAS